MAPHNQFVNAATFLVPAIGAFATHFAQPSRAEARRIYWAEGLADDQYLIREALGNNAFVTFFKDDKDLLQAIDQGHPDLVVLNLNMPHVGIGTVKQLRQRADDKALPIVIFSTARSEAEAQACQDLGVQDFLKKAPDFATFSRQVVEIAAMAKQGT